MPIANKDLLHFLSTDPIDKIVQQGEITIVNDGNTTTSGTGTGEQTARIVSDTVPNSYGRAGLVRARWSIDGGTNWQSLETEIVYTFTLTITDIPLTDTLSGLDSAISIGCSDSTITFRTANGRHGNVSILSTDPIGTGYTPTSRTFIIQYALYEWD
jgi:hypothetical protein